MHSCKHGLKPARFFLFNNSLKFFLNDILILLSMLVVKKLSCIGCNHTMSVLSAELHKM